MLDAEWSLTPPMSAAAFLLALVGIIVCRQPFSLEHVLDGMNDARLAGALPAATDVLEVLHSLLFLESRTALVEEQGRQQKGHRLELVQGALL